MKTMLAVCFFLLVLLFLDGMTDRVAKIPNKSKITYFAFDRECPIPGEFLDKLQERYDVAVFTNDIWVAPSTQYIQNGKTKYSVDITEFSIIRFRHQIFPRRYYMNYNPIGFVLYISDRGWNEYYGGVVLTGITPEMLSLKINPFGRFRDYQIALPQWVNRISLDSVVQIASEIVIAYPDELKDFSDSYIAPYLYRQTGNMGIITSKPDNPTDDTSNMDFLSLPFSVSVNGHVICTTVSELYDNQFFRYFNDVLRMESKQ